MSATSTMHALVGQSQQLKFDGRLSGTREDKIDFPEKSKRLASTFTCHACLDSSEEIDCPSSNIHNLGSFASIELIFCLNRSRI